MPAILCFSHLRWNSVYQRPQHLMTRFAKVTNVFFIEEPIYDSPWHGFHSTRPSDDMNVTVLVPRLNKDLKQNDIDRQLGEMLREFLDANEIHEFISWYYSPMAVGYTKSIASLVTVYDCMDELSAFRFAPAELKERESWLFTEADIVFTGGHTLFKAKCGLHNNIHSFPSSIDKEHFMQARQPLADLDDQAAIPFPRLGYYGVLDERIDLALIRDVAALRPDWHFIFVGPVVKIDPSTLPTAPNIHYLGPKAYEQLPYYLAGWDIAIIPFALNESTQFISPTKTPEYLAGGKPVISTAISDVVNDYGNNGLVKICGSPQQFVGTAQTILAFGPNSTWLELVDRHLSHNSWENTWKNMTRLIDEALESKKQANEKFLQTCSITL